MRTFTLILATAALIAAPAMARPGKDTWYLLSVSRNYNEALLVDVTSLKTLEGSKRSAPIEVVEVVAPQSGEVGSISARAIFDCAAKTVEVTEATSYDIDNHVLNTSSGEKPLVPVSGSRGEQELKFMCSDPATWDKSRLIDEGAVGGVHQGLRPLQAAGHGA